MPIAEMTREKEWEITQAQDRGRMVVDMWQEMAKLRANPTAQNQQRLDELVRRVDRFQSMYSGTSVQDPRVTAAYIMGIGYGMCRITD